MLRGNEIHGEMRRGLSSLRSFHVASRRPETMKVGSGQWAVGSVDLFTAHRPLPTAHYFLRSLHVASRRPGTMKRGRAMYRRLSNLRRLHNQVAWSYLRGSLIKPPQVRQPTVRVLRKLMMAQAQFTRNYVAARGGSSNQYYLDRQSQFESNARSYPRRLPLAIREARGVWITDVDGRRFLDCLSNAGTLALGHNHPVVVEAIKRQL